MAEFSMSRVLEGHYSQYRQPGDPIKPLDRTECKVKGCHRSPYSEKMCKVHADMAFYKAQQRKGR